MADHSWKLEKLSFHRDSSYDTGYVKRQHGEMKKMVLIIYYVADGSGVSIDKEKLEVVSQ